jgi:hypothetical protein
MRDSTRNDIPSPAVFHSFLPGSLEAVAAPLLLSPATMGAGTVLLLAIFVTAFRLHALREDFTVTLPLCAAGVFFVRAHGTGPRRARSPIP